MHAHTLKITMPASEKLTPTKKVGRTPDIERDGPAVVVIVRRELSLKRCYAQQQNEAKRHAFIHHARLVVV